MPIGIVDIVVGGLYATANNQERHVTKIEHGKVHYESRGGNVKNEWSYGHSISQPPSLESFAEACDRVLSKP
jgi:hypothetical protein